MYINKLNFLLAIGVSIMKKSQKFIRKMDIITKLNSIEVYVNIEYIPKMNDGLRNNESINYNIPVYSIKELKENLQKNKIIYGIIENSLEKCTDIEGVKNLLVAKGTSPVHGTDDTLEISFRVENTKKFEEDSNGKIDFKSRGYVDYVKKNDVIAILHRGVSGYDGLDVYGRSIKHTPGKKIHFKVGEGCIIRNDKVIALISGKPSFIDNTFYISEFHEINSDVDIKTGNIKFNGAILINGNVKEDMIVQSGDCIDIKGNVEGSKIIARRNVNIYGNVIFSTISSGQEEVNNIKNLNIFSNLKDNILELIKVANHIKKFNKLEKNISYGEIIKILIENRFKIIIKLCNDILNPDEYTYNLFVKKIFNLSPLKINNSEELIEIVNAIDRNIQNIKRRVLMPSDVYISYCQDSIIESSGSIIIRGIGAYVSHLTAKNSIVFEKSDSILRGGSIKAGKEIRCGIVGSLNGVSTKISVERRGHIYAKKAYANTIFSIDNIEYILEKPCREVHAYLNYNREFKVDKLL